MDESDSRTCEIEKDAEHLYSHEKLDTLGKEMGLSSSGKKFTDESIVLEKQGQLGDQDITSCEADSLPAKEDCPNYDHVSAGDCTRGDISSNLKSQSCVVSTSRNLVAEVGMCEEKNCAEGISGAASCSNGYASSRFQSELTCDGNQKDGEVSMDGTDSTKHISTKSDIDSDIGLPLNGENNELDVGNMHGNRLKAGEDGLKSIVIATCHDTHHKTESSSSNSTHVLAVPSSKCNYQEMSVGTKSSRHNSSGTNSSICTDLKCSVEEPLAGGAVLGMAAQITQKAVENVRARDSKKVMEMITDQNSRNIEKVVIPKFSLSKQKNVDLLSQHEKELSYELDDAVRVAWKVAREVEQKVGFYKEASGSTSSIEERIGEAPRLSSIDSTDPSKNKFSIEPRQGVKLCNEQDNCDSFHSYKDVMDAETTVRNEHFLAGKGQLKELNPEMRCETNDACYGQKSSHLTVKTKTMAVSDKTPIHSRFDLNEDICVNEVEYPTQFVDESISSDNMMNVTIMPIPVMAKSGIPVCLPVTSLKFDGEQGWKGSAATSAFRPASLSKSSNAASSINENNCRSKHSVVSSVIDLNVAAVEDDSAIELLREHVGVSSGFTVNKSSAEVGSKRAETLKIDLNCLGENEDECPLSSMPVSLLSHSRVDFDLNYSPSLRDTCNDAHCPAQHSQPLQNKALDAAAVSFMGNTRQPDFDRMRPAYWGDLSSMQRLSRGHAGPFMVAAPSVLQPMEQMQRIAALQPRLPHIPQTIGSHGHPYSTEFCIGPADPLSSTLHSSGVLPYIPAPHQTAVIPQILGSATLSTFPGVPYVMELAHGRIPSENANIRPSFGINIGENSSENGSRGDNTVQFLYTARNTSMEELMKSSQQGVLSATPMKRREPEGGWDSYQLAFRQGTSWH